MSIYQQLKRYDRHSRCSGCKCPFKSVGQKTNDVISMVAYFCHHLSDNNVDLSDLCVVLSDRYVDLSDLYVDLSDLNVDFSLN